MGCSRALAEDFLRLVSLAYLAGGLALIWSASLVADLTQPRSLLAIQTYWYPDTVGLFGTIFTLLGTVCAIGAWRNRSLPLSWFAGASLVALVPQAAVSLTFFDNRDSFWAASKHDATHGLAATLRWITKNETMFSVMLYAALFTQVLGVLASTCRVTCCRGRCSRRRYRYGYRHRHQHSFDEHSPLLPRSYSPLSEFSGRTPQREQRASSSGYGTPVRPFTPVQ